MWYYLVVVSIFTITISIKHYNIINEDYIIWYTCIDVLINLQYCHSILIITDIILKQFMRWNENSTIFIFNRCMNLFLMIFLNNLIYFPINIYLYSHYLKNLPQ